MPVKRALISVSDKTGVVDFARALEEMGVEILSTGGTAQILRQAGVRVTLVAEVTGFPEILGGRVKTLHPAVHAGILAERKPEHLNQIGEFGIRPIDLVAVNLYPFKKTIAREGVTLAEAIENIDIGGPAMIRAAAKNHAYVVVVVNPARYTEVIEALRRDGDVSAERRLALAQEAFAHTAHYDAAIATYLAGFTVGVETFPAEAAFPFERVQVLRYGENPHQRAAFYRDLNARGASVATARQLHGKELSYNNILDLNAAFELVCEFTEPAAVIVKHNNPCGVSSRTDLAEAYRLAYAGDPVSAFGGIVACNRPVDGATAAEMAKIFLEAVIAPDFTPEALEILTRKANLRLLATGPVEQGAGDWLQMRKVNGGLLVQEADRALFREGDLKVVTAKRPTEEQIAEMAFAFAIVKHVKSNAIVVTKDRMLLGVGAGQMNRVGAARIALEQAGEKARGAVLASDAFFPFPDTVEEAARAGIAAIVQPGGSIRDEESIKAADAHGIAMLFTGMRHFKH